MILKISQSSSGRRKLKIFYQKKEKICFLPIWVMINEKFTYHNMDPKQQQEIAKAVKVFNQGGIVIFPTDTAFGIGCRIDNEKAIKRLFKIRKRAETQAVPVLVSGLEMARNYLKPIP